MDAVYGVGVFFKEGLPARLCVSFGAFSGVQYVQRFSFDGLTVIR
jgi:hypothetical protein